MPYRSEFYGVDVRDEIVREFTDAEGRVDDMLAGLHEIRARLMSARFRTHSPASVGAEKDANDTSAGGSRVETRTDGGV